METKEHEKEENAASGYPLLDAVCAWDIKLGENMDKKYLYTDGDSLDKYMRRYEIIRETKTLYILKGNGENSEIRVPKKGMCINHGRYSWTNYYAETPEILNKFKKSILTYKYKAHLDKLKNIDSIEIMEKVLSITIPE